MTEAERLAQALEAWDGKMMMPPGWRDRVSRVLRSQDDELRRLQAENESLRADAERYRWLRETSKKRPEFYSGEEAWMVSHEHGNGTGSNYFGEKIDAAIDAARKA